VSLRVAVCHLPGVAAPGPPLLSGPGLPSNLTTLAGWLACVSVGVLLLLGGLTAARAQALNLPLQCRLGEGAWQPCRMEIQTLGEHWWLQIGSERIEFRHGGDGSVRMQRAGAWRAVTPSWQGGTSLCWDGVCAQGAIPLD
jgi:hypothetical protein